MMIHGLDDGGGVGWQEEEDDGLEGALDFGMGSAIFQDEGLLLLLSGEDLVLLVRTGIEEDASHPGLLVGVKLHWQLMDVDPLLAEGVQLPGGGDDQGLQLAVA